MKKVLAESRKGTAELDGQMSENVRELVIVTDEDINTGVQGSASRCPIAIAVRREFKEEFGVSGAYFYDVGGDYATLPPEAGEFIHTFDRKGRDAVEPFSFWVLVPSHWKKRGQY